MAIAVVPVLDRLLPPLFVGLHALLFSWAAVGLAEWIVVEVPWPAITNPLFPRWLLLPHWLAVLGASALFLLGYTRRWQKTPALLIPAYAFMAAICAVETFFFLTHSLRYVAMVLEYVAYVLILLALYRVPRFVRRFQLLDPGAQAVVT
jgi:hypothetical protein